MKRKKVRKYRYFSDAELVDCTGDISFIGLNRPTFITNYNFDRIFKDISFDLSYIIKEGVICSICFGEFSKDDEPRLSPCKHIFHINCIYEWTVENRLNFCPFNDFKIESTNISLADF